MPTVRQANLDRRNPLRTCNRQQPGACHWPHLVLTSRAER